MTKWAFAAISLLLLAACAASRETARPAGNLQAGANFVAMGSSFAAGAGIGPLQLGSPPRCMRNVNNYATVLADKLSLTLTDVSCAGATTEHLLSSWNELPAQIDAVNSETRLVTITVGGNDLNYVVGLFAASCKLGATIVSGPCTTAKAPSVDDYIKLEQNLEKLAEEIYKRAPRATIVFVQYVRLIPASPCGLAVIGSKDSEAGTQVAARLAAITAKVGRKKHAVIIDADRRSRNHTPCSIRPWSNGIYPGYDMTNGLPWHPNADGHRAIAMQIAAKLSRSNNR